MQALSNSVFVMIVGTNGSGKSTLMRTIIRLLGGGKTYGNHTEVDDPRVAVVGLYEGRSQCGCGCDNFKTLTEIRSAIRALKKKFPIVLAEGKYIGWFSNENICAYSEGSERHLIVFLDCDEATIRRNIASRNGKFNPEMVTDNKNLGTAAEKYKQIGFSLLRIPPAFSPQEKASLVINAISKLTKQQF